MLDISISSTKIRGRPKGRPADKPHKYSDQIIYPEKTRQYFVIKCLNWPVGVKYRQANGNAEKFTTRFQSDLYY